MRTVSCDVWHEGSNRAVFETSNLNEAKTKMRELWIYGVRGIRMYAYYSDSERYVYYFGADGKIKKEDNALDN